jgi:3-hydroxyacyl-CoA dehydrogenase
LQSVPQNSSYPIPKKIACVGSGIIGSSWALFFAMKGLTVIAYDVNDEVLSTSRKTVEVMLDSLVENRVVDAGQRGSILSRINPTTTLADIGGTDYVQESVSESLETKIRVFGEVEREVSDKTIIATSTSGLPISEIQVHLRHPERSVIAHPFNPPHLIPLVEIVPGDATSDGTVMAIRAFLKQMGKEPVLVKKQLPGFAANRIQFALFREVLNLLNDGVVDIEDLEKVFSTGLGIRFATMGPFTTYSMAGGKRGLEAYFERYGPDAQASFESMKTWTSIPEPVKREAIAQTDHLSTMTDKSYDERVRWRDGRLIGVLRQLGYLPS